MSTIPGPRSRSEAAGWKTLVPILLLCAFAGWSGSALDLGQQFTKALGAIAGLTALVLVFLYPVRSIGVLIAVWAPTVFIMMDVQLGSFMGIELRLTRALGGLLIVALSARCVARIARLRGLPPFPRPLVIYSVFAAVLLVQFARSPATMIGFADLVRFAAGFLIVATLWMETSDERTFRYLIRCALLGIVSSGVLSLLLWFRGFEALVHKMTGISRAVGTFGHVNETGHLALLGVALLLAYLPLCRTPRSWLFWSGSLVTLLATMAFTLSRSALFGLGILLVAWAIADRGKTIPTRYFAFAIVIGLVGLLGAFSFFESSALATRLADIPGLGNVAVTDEQAGSGRIGIWSHQLGEYSKEGFLNQAFGQGLGSSMVVARRMYTARDLLFGKVMGPHNSYIWLLVEFGFVGLLFYLSFVFSLGRHCIRALRGRFRSSEDDTARFAQSLLMAFLAYLWAYHLSKEFFGWGITSMGVRMYFLIFMTASLLAIRYWSLPAKTETADPTAASG